MKKLLVLVTLAVLLAGLAVYYYAERGHVLRLSEADLQSQIEARTPFTRTHLLIFDVTLDSPRVALRDGTDRAEVSFVVLLGVRAGRGTVPLRGTVDLSGGVRYDAERGELFLTDPLVERSSIEGVPDRYEANINDALTRAMAEYFRTRPIYALRPTDARLAATRLLLRDVTVEDRHLVLTFGLR